MATTLAPRPLIFRGAARFLQRPAKIPVVMSATVSMTPSANTSNSAPNAPETIGAASIPPPQASAADFDAERAKLTPPSTVRAVRLLSRNDVTSATCRNSSTVVCSTADGRCSCAPVRADDILMNPGRRDWQQTYSRAIGSPHLT